MPEVRAASARAFGTMVKSMGEKGVGDLLPWLFDTLTSEGSTVDRSGAAQGAAVAVVVGAVWLLYGCCMVVVWLLYGCCMVVV